MSDDIFDPPGKGDSIDWKLLNGRLLLIKPHALKLQVPTQDYGPKDAIEADVHVLDGPATADVKAGQAFHNSYVFPLVLQGQIRSGIGSGRFSLGRLEQGPVRKGNPPWQLADPTEADKALARKYLESDVYKKNEPAAAPAQAAPAAAASADPWGAAPAAQPAQAAAPGADPWGGDEPPF